MLKPETIAEWLVRSKTRDGSENNYSFGWVLGLDNEGKLLSMGHGGAGAGFLTMIDRNLVTKRTIIVLCNSGSTDPAKISGPVDRLCNAMPHRFFWRHGDGFFEFHGNSRWSETAPGGGTFHFVETYRTDHYVELFDKGRECTVRLNQVECQVRFNDDKFEKYYDGKWASK